MSSLPRAAMRFRFTPVRGIWLLLCGLATWGFLAGGLPLPVWAIDDFDRHTPEILQLVLDSEKPLAEISQQTTARWKPLHKNDESVTAILKTGDGQLVKVQLSWGFRKIQDKPAPVVVFDRFVTYSSGGSGSTTAQGKNVMLFPGFQFDFDLGQVVPADLGGDVQLTPQGTLKCLPGVEIYPVQGSKLPAEATGKTRSGDNEPVVPEDFAGAWEVDADGRWQGTWDLKVTDDGVINGTFLSDETQGTYPVAGGIGDLPHHAKLTVTFSNSQQIIDAYLWTKDKSAMAGTFRLAGRTFGFSAKRKSDNEPQKQE